MLNVFSKLAIFQSIGTHEGIYIRALVALAEEIQTANKENVE